MRIGNSDTIAEREHEKIDSELSYSPRLGAALKVILGDPAFVGEQETFSFKFLRDPEQELDATQGLPPTLSHATGSDGQILRKAHSNSAKPGVNDAGASDV